MTRQGALPGQPPEKLAAEWFSRVRSGAMSDIDEAALEDWLDADPANQSAYDAVERTWHALELVRLHPRVMAMRDAVPVRSRFSFARLPPSNLIAASIAALFVGLVSIGVLTTSTPTPPASPPPAASVASAPSARADGQFASHVYRTGAHERAVITLPDGSEVLLSENASLRTIPDIGRRSLRLEQGRAFFRVAKDTTHPFVVEAEGRTITAVGTAFEVVIDKRGLAVTLVEGRVRVQTPVAAPRGPDSKTAAAPSMLEATEMAAGSRFAANAEGWSVSRADVQESTSWTRDQLVFQARPLAEVAAQMSLRSPRKIIVLDDDVGRTLISGNFRPGDVDTFARALAAYDYASVATRPDGSIEISRP